MRGVCWGLECIIVARHALNASDSRRCCRFRYDVGVNWNDAAEDFLNQVLSQTPRPLRESTEADLRGLAEALSEEEGKQRVGVETVIAAWIRNTPEALRPDLPRQMERFGLDPADYQGLFR